MMLITTIAVIARIISNPLGNVFQKKLTQNGKHPLIVNFITYLLLAFISLFFIRGIDFGSLSVTFWIYSLLGGIAGAIGNGFLVKALESGDLSVLGPVNAYKSVVGLIVGIIILKEIPGIWGLAGMLLIIGGSYFVLDTLEERFSWALLKRKDIQYRLWAMVLTAIEAVFIKNVIIESNSVIAFISWCVFGTVFSLVMLGINRVSLSGSWRTLTLSDGGNFGLLILCMGIMQLTTNYVLANMPVAYGLALFQLSTIVSIFLGYSIFQETAIGRKLFGAIIMIAGSTLIIFFS